jgi:FixJ family two-component response regulator
MSNSNGFRVALVDDDASICKALSRLLCAAGVSSTIFNSAEAFLADPANSDYACLVLDIQLGGMSGFDLQRTLRAAGSSMPIIFITAYDETETRAEAERAGCVAYLRKTDPGSAVIAAVQRAVHSKVAAERVLAQDLAVVVP